MDYSIMQEMFQKIREQNDDEYWLDILAEMPKEEQLALFGTAKSNLSKPNSYELQDNLRDSPQDDIDFSF